MHLPALETAALGRKASQQAPTVDKPRAQVVVRRAELAEQSREEEEMAARVEAEVSRRIAEAIETDAITARIEAKLKVTGGCMSCVKRHITSRHPDTTKPCTAWQGRLVELSRTGA